jgi:hypothetical protein
LDGSEMGLEENASDAMVDGRLAEVEI